MLLSSCASTPAAEFRGRWKPVNRFDEAPQAIALQPAYAYYAAPLDGTLKSMLERWAGDTGMSLSYQSSMDYTLYGAVAQVHSADLAAALAQVNDIYASQGLAISVENNSIVVRQAASANAAATSSSP
ncbi:hypothetical protein ABB29_00990 [Pseudoxanthomonas dokdonensis]|uniref:Toxin co-regulated pilus biosynthesis protein Q C-terminal domain-containing protein n=2 Tax=Pseudoxanthomonas dokdonensis TaxID=344882 RepID=A0A0R0CZP7_9GAMM|nr:hypothetical protein ABB29_00990 [Pseudoxanthomonas dokdonensis]